MTEEIKIMEKPKIKTELDQVKDLHAEVQLEVGAMKRHIAELNHHIEMLSDVARMNASTQILAAVITEVPDMDQYESGQAIKRAVGLADDLISFYQDLMEKKAAEQRKILDEMDSEQETANPDHTVQ